mmetsp:Transcript_18164/g.28436  ORF Transcript_18164/g.28436 Transcript_18164/m.28436 type:complete len:93 (-) Transcript_18164:191-469(-)
MNNYIHKSLLYTHYQLLSLEFYLFKQTPSHPKLGACSSIDALCVVHHLMEPKNSDLFRTSYQSMRIIKSLHNVTNDFINSYTILNRSKYGRS